MLQLRHKGNNDLGVHIEEFMTTSGVQHLSSQEPEWRVRTVQEHYTLGDVTAVTGDESHSNEDCKWLKAPAPKQRPSEADANLPVSSIDHTVVVHDGITCCV